MAKKDRSAHPRGHSTLTAAPPDRPAETDRGPAERREPEVVIARLRPHARALFFPALALIAVAGAAGFFGGTFDRSWQTTLFYVSAGGGAVLLWLLPLLIWLNRRYTVTTRRLILKHGFFVRVRQELLHSRGYDISVSRGPLQSIFRSGDIRINTGLEAPVVLRDVPGAGLVLSTLQDLMESSANPMASRRQQEDSTSQHATDETRSYGRR